MSLKKEFQRLAAEELSFLNKELGFSRVSTEKDFYLKYESEKVAIEITYDTFSFEINVSISLLDSPKTKYDLNEVMQLYLKQIVNTGVALQASSIENIKSVLSKVGVYLSIYSERLLTGDLDEFSRLKAIRTSNFENQKDSWNRSKLSRAWDDKNYEEVINYGEKLNSLSEAEQRKVEYSKKKIIDKKN